MVNRYKKEEEKKDKQVMVYLNLKQFNDLNKFSFKNEFSRSSVVRTFIKEGLEKRMGDN